MVKKIHSLQFNEKPWWFRAINNTSKSLGIKTNLDIDQLIKNARKSTGLRNLGNDFYEEPLKRLIVSIQQEASLHPIGMFITKQRLQNLLATRLKAEYWFNKYPEILEQELYPVKLIAGLQRTGTTKLHRLLGSDPDNRTLASWEALNPAPSHNKKSKDPRIKFARTAEKSLKIMAPGFFAIHPVEHLSEEEDILLLDVSFMSTTPEATMYVPSYASWLEQTDQTLAYTYLIKLLKLLQWQKPGKKWVLKSPHHLEFLSIIDKQFQNIQYLWTHRDVKKTIPSFLSMLAHGYSIFSNDIQLQELSDHWTKKTKYMLEKAIAFRKSGKEEKFIDIHFESFVSDPLQSLKEIYGGPESLDSSLIEIFKKTDAINYRGKYGIHDYHLSDFNLSEDKVDLEYEFYGTFINSLESGIK